MISSLKQEFSFRPSSFVRLMGSLAAGSVMAVASFNAAAEAPPQGSPQWNKMSPHGGFIHGAQQKGTTTRCCDFSDGRMGVPEIEVRADNLDAVKGKCPEAKPGDYCVLATKEAYGQGIPEAGTWVHVPKEKIFDPRDWERDPDGDGPKISQRQECENKSRAEGKNISRCDPPADNVLWWNKTSNHLYCYWRKPRL